MREEVNKDVLKDMDYIDKLALSYELVSVCYVCMYVMYVMCVCSVCIGRIVKGFVVSSRLLY